MAKKILIVDDEPVITKVIQSRLVTNGYEVIIAADGQEALAKTHAEKPDLIILDLMLPKVDGYRVCRLLKLDDSYKHIPIIMLTARVQKQDKEMGYEVGADAYFPKPYNAQLLIDKIKELLKE